MSFGIFRPFGATNLASAGLWLTGTGAVKPTQNDRQKERQDFQDFKYSFEISAPKLTALYQPRWNPLERFAIQIDQAPEPAPAKPITQRARAFLHKTVEDTLVVSIRAANVLDRLQVRLIWDLAQKTEGDVLRVKDCGIKTLKEIKRELGRLGLSLGMTLDPLEEPAPPKQEINWSLIHQVRRMADPTVRQALEAMSKDAQRTLYAEASAGISSYFQHAPETCYRNLCLQLARSGRIDPRLLSIHPFVSRRILPILEKERISTLGEASALKDKDFLKFKGFGKKSLDQLRGLLEEFLPETPSGGDGRD